MDIETEYEWNEQKSLSNQAKHKISFEIAILAWDGFAYEWPDIRSEYGEDRISAIGEVDGHTVFIAYTWRNGRRRIISARKANRNEQRSYRQALARQFETGSG